MRCYADDFRLGLEDLAAGVTALETLPTDEAFPKRRHLRLVRRFTAGQRDCG